MRLGGHPLGLLVLLLTICIANAKKSEPTISTTKFDGTPGGLFYFDDTDILLVQDREGSNVYRSADAGETWDLIKGVPDGEAFEVYQHPYDNNVAYVLSLNRTHWVTDDRGESWRQFQTDAPPALFKQPLGFHAGDSKKVLFQGQDCEAWICKDVTFFTVDGFKTTQLLREQTRSCTFARATDLFTTGTSLADDDRILCIVEGRYSPWAKDNRLVVSDDYFTDEYEPALESDRTVQGIINMASVKKYWVAAAKAEGTDELALYISDDAKTWHRAVFPNEHKLEEDAYTLLESTNYSIQLDVMTTRPTNPMGVLFTSNSNGTYFTRNVEHTNRNIIGLVDFEKVQGIQGIVLVNTVKNFKEVEGSYAADKILQTAISFDDGRTWEDLKVGKKKLHLHSVTEMRNAGRVFSSPAPGLVMGIGNTGDELGHYHDGDLFVSDDAGLTWRKALDGPHLYEFGDQGSVLVAIKDVEFTSKVYYSIDHGKEWESVDLDQEIRAQQLTTTPDSTSLKFVLIGSKGRGLDIEHIIFSLDFEGLHERKCKDSDFEKWWARLDDDGKPSCIMGHKQYYNRRKPDADCFIDEEFKDPRPQYEPCPCTDADFECDYNFVRSEDRKECTPVGMIIPPDGECKNIDDDFMGTSGWRLIPGNDCVRKDGVEKDKPVERPCRDTIKKPASGQVSHETNTFKANAFREYFYLERTETSTGDDETVIMRTDQQEIYLSRDHGKTWEEILVNYDILAIYPHQYFNDVVYFITASKTVYYSMERGLNIREFQAPHEPNHDRLQIIGFHPDHKDWLIWTGGAECSGWSGDCHSAAHVTTHRGDNDWQPLLDYVRKCQFIPEKARGGSEKLVYCEQYQDEDKAKPLQLIASDNWFDDRKVHFQDIIDFATMSEFIIVAAKDEDQKSLKVDASVDGSTFAEALFPPNFKVPHQQAYTVLDSSTHSVFLHVTVNSLAEHEYGSIIKSNSNGTSYVLSLEAVNRNSDGYVDFEKMQGLEGVAVVNVVDNAKLVDNGQAKKLKTMITHNDGAEWSLLEPPEKDSEGRKFDCSGGLQKCSLHLHGYTERKDPRDTFSSPSAVGLMVGVGNVGEYLGQYKTGNTFITRDGGITWHEVKKGTYMWEYGDQGAIVVIVEESTPTDVIFYSLDEGETWTEYKFSNEKMQIQQISTVPSDTSRNFLLWATTPGGDGIATVNLDFSGLTDRQCTLDEESPEEGGDYYLWEPRHPMQDNNCLFGHVAQYHRKEPQAECYNGRKIDHLHSIARNCSCTRQDFECDYNFQRQNDGSCALIGEMPDHSQICRDDPNTLEYWKPTGYRRIPLDTCSGGRELEFSGQSIACPGREKEYKKKRKGISGVGLFFAITMPICAAAAVGWWVWRNWDGKFGRIHLGDTASGAGFDGTNPLIRWPVVAVSGLVAVVATLPLLASSLWRSVAGLFGRGGSGGGYGAIGGGGAGRRYTTRSSFARGRGDYAVVDEDEGELLGDESDEEV
ncbi:MAG: hypothetical protein M1819_004965 [Sarea resinae]|nr:MAG: hypothetical protein M1819_004965 [Sarea resinae]